MAESTIIKVKGDGTLTALDNGGTNSHEFAFEEGNLTLNIPGRTVVVYRDRGLFGATPSVRFSDDQEITGTFTVNLRDISDATDVTAFEFIAGPSGQVGSTYVSTLGVNAEVPLFTFRWDIVGVVHGDAAEHRVECNFCFFSGSSSEGDPDVLTMNFTSFDVYPTVT